MSSLLAHLHTRIKGSPEDVATLSLCYILENSKSARKAFSEYISQIIGIGNLPELNFRTQIIGDNVKGLIYQAMILNNELVLCESKFWAGLTDNQPLGYIKRLRDNGVSAEKALILYVLIKE